MTLDDLRQTLNQAIETQKIGTPVSLRLHLQLADPQADLISTLAAIMHLADPFVATKPATLVARQEANGRQLTVLLENSQGRTIFLTVGRGSIGTASLYLTLVGNHGVVRLEGAELFDETSVQEFSSKHSVDHAEWRTCVEESFGQGQAVVLN